MCAQRFLCVEERLREQNKPFVLHYVFAFVFLLLGVSRGGQSHLCAIGEQATHAAHSVAVSALRFGSQSSLELNILLFVEK